MYEEFYSKYESDEKEVIVLIQKCLGAGYNNNGDFWEMTALSLGMIFCENGKLYDSKGRLEWPIAEGEQNTDKGWNRFEREQIYRIKVRRLLDKYVPEHIAPKEFNYWAVTEVICKESHCKELEKILEVYREPVIIEDKMLGTLELNKDFEVLEGSVIWSGKEIYLMIEIDSEDDTSIEKACEFAREFISSNEIWDKKMREFVAESLTELANEWLDNEEGKNKKSITKEEFATRISISEISIYNEGTFTAYFDDDDMFWGHIIEVYGSIEEGIESANISG